MHAVILQTQLYIHHTLCDVFNCECMDGVSCVGVCGIQVGRLKGGLEDRGYRIRGSGGCLVFGPFRVLVPMSRLIGLTHTHTHIYI